MKKLTIAEMREREVNRLISLCKWDRSFVSDAEISRKAHYLMNSFYRLCGLCERNLYISNNERFCNSRYAKELEQREDAWYKRLDKEFSEFAGLRLCYCSFLPSIGCILEHGAFSEKISRYFYEY